MTDDAVPPAPPKRFVGPLFFWLFVFLLPTMTAGSTAALFVHEFAHGLVALATGGHFLGVVLGPSHRRTPTMAYADAWSDGYETPVFLAGIVVCALVGLFLLWRAYRTRSLLPRLTLFLAASCFLADWDYAFEGALYWKTSDFDVAVVLERAGSAGLRWVCLIALGLAVLAKGLLVARGLFRTWEEVLGPFTAGQAFWVVMLLGFPAPVPSTGMEGAVRTAAAATAFLIAMTVWLIRTRRAAVPPPSIERRARWCWAAWGAMIVAVFGIYHLYKGIEVGTYQDITRIDLDPPRKTAVGVLSTYGLMDKYGEREVISSRLFLSTPEGLRILNSPVDEVLDVAWLPAMNQILVASAGGLHQVDVPSEQSTRVWKPESGLIDKAFHGPGGELLLIQEQAEGFGRPSRYSAYAYDPRRRDGTLHEAKGVIGNPWFVSASPARAHLSVDNDIWVLTWPEGDEEEVRLDREEGASPNRWLEGISSGRRWWGDSREWWCGDTRIANQDLMNWGAGTDGFYTLGNNGRWQLTTPDGDRTRGGTLQASSVLFLQIRDGIPWILFRDGEVRRLEEETPSFRAQLPKK